MISVDLARRLLVAGLVWEPLPGDRFVVADRGMDEEVFVVSQMTVEVHRSAEGRVIGFNGTTEWALDSVQLTEALWLPAEGRLREELGDRFAGLWREGEEWVVALREDPDSDFGSDFDSDFDSDRDSDRDSAVTRFQHPDCECAYALALLSILQF